MTVHDHHLVSPQYNIPATGCGLDVSSWGFWKTVRSRFLKNSFAASFAQTAAFRLHRYLKIYERGVDLFLCPSEYMRQQLVSAGFLPERVRTVHTGIDATAIEPRYDHDGYILSAGRLSEEKGIALQIELARRLPDLRFKIAGTGPQETELHQLAQDLPNVEFVGYQTGDALHRLYQGAMMVLIPSRVRETFPITALDSMARGTPVVGSAVGGMREVVQDRVTGMLAPPDDVSAWLEAVMRLAYDEQTRLAMAHAARLSMETDFHMKRHHASVIAAYEEILRRRQYV
jgi:glycosyltransferase involved in cell wall biosynthesis